MGGKAKHCLHLLHDYNKNNFSSYLHQLCHSSSSEQHSMQRYYCFTTSHTAERHCVEIFPLETYQMLTCFKTSTIMSLLKQPRTTRVNYSPITMASVVKSPSWLSTFHLAPKLWSFPSVSLVYTQVCMTTLHGLFCRVGGLISGHVLAALCVPLYLSGKAGLPTVCS